MLILDKYCNITYVGEITMLTTHISKYILKV